MTERQRDVRNCIKILREVRRLNTLEPFERILIEKLIVKYKLELLVRPVH